MFARSAPVRAPIAYGYAFNAMNTATVKMLIGIFGTRCEPQAAPAPD